MDRADVRHLPPAVLNERRRRAVKLRERGMTLREVAAHVELSVPTVTSAHRAYLAGGWKAVDVKPRGRKSGQGRHLTPEQEAGIRRLISDKTPEQLTMGFALWNRQAVAQLMEACLGVDVPIRTVGEYLKRWGFTPQKPIRKAYEQSPTEVRKWLDEDYPQMAARARAEGAEIHWGDETGLRCDDVRGRGYAPKGQTPVVRVNNKREGLSIISTVTNQGKVRWKVFDGAMNADILIDFFKRLIRDADRKVFLILDNLRVHHARKVKAWLGEHEDQIEVFYLPSYSPELNPDECLNADIKDGVTRRAPARSKSQLRKAAISHLRRLQKSPGRVRKYFQHKPVRYVA
ncbi:MAG: IS630 family transposase [Parahaliea sp.]